MRGYNWTLIHAWVILYNSSIWMKISLFWTKKNRLISTRINQINYKSTDNYLIYSIGTLRPLKMSSHGCIITTMYPQIRLVTRRKTIRTYQPRIQDLPRKGALTLIDPPGAAGLGGRLSYNFGKIANELYEITIMLDSGEMGDYSLVSRQCLIHNYVYYKMTNLPNRRKLGWWAWRKGHTLK